MARNYQAKLLKKLRICMHVLCGVGIILSLYALYVELIKEADSSYQAMCDISPSMSCSKVFTSEYGRGFGIIGKYLGKGHILNQPNSIAGIIFYLLIIIMGEMRSNAAAKIQTAVVFCSNFMSLYLGYILYFVLHDLCIVCVSTYAVNLLLTIFGTRRLFVLLNFKKKDK